MNSKQQRKQPQTPPPGPEFNPVNQAGQLSQDQLEELHLRGLEASAFLRGLEEGSRYFLTVLNELYNEYVGQLLSLKPNEQEEFTMLKAKIDVLFKPIQRVHEDIEAGKQAEEMLGKPGNMNKGGLL